MVFMGNRAGLDGKPLLSRRAVLAGLGGAGVAACQPMPVTEFAPDGVWSRAPRMPSPRHGLGAVGLGGDIHVIGGALGVGGRDTSALVEVFTPN